MTQIETINLHNFSNREHHRFMAEFNKLVSAYPASILGLDVLYGLFQNTLKAEDLALRVEEGSTISKNLEQLGQLREKTWNAIDLRVKATLFSPLAEEAQSAQVIEQIIQQYGDIYSKTYIEQSSAVTNLLNDLLLPVDEVHMDRMGISTWVIELKRRNEQFQELYNERSAEFAGHESDDVKTVRSLIDPIYQQLVDKINATILLEFAQPEAITFVNKLNEKIKHDQSILFIRNSQSKA
ncbi:MAG TPA: DUF6261 family protein [Prolixibacteraceae bacterium]|jgi:hypothetical protein